MEALTEQTKAKILGMIHSDGFVWLTANQAASLGCVCRQTIHYHYDKGHLRGKILENRLYVIYDDVLRVFKPKEYYHHPLYVEK